MTLFTFQSAAMFYDKLFSSLDFTLPGAATGRRGFPKEAMVCAFIVMKCEGFTQITDLADYLDNNRLIAHYCGFNIMEPLPSYWTYDRFLKKMDNAALKEIMAAQVKKLYEMGIVDASFVGLDSTPVMANTKQNNPKSFAKNKFSKENHPKSDPDCALGVHSASNQHNERRYEFYWGYKSHVLVDCISGLPLYELTTPGNVADPAVAAEILAAADQTISLKECAFLADKGYDVKSIYNTVKTVYDGEAFIPLNPRGTKDLKALPAGNPVCEAGLAMHKDGKTTDNGAEVFEKAGERDAIRAQLGAGDRTVILSFGGSLGARRVNEVVADLCAWEQKENKPVLHIHATGQYGVELFKNLEREKGFAPGESLEVKEYINNMPELLAAADLVISRAGALTLAELEAEGRAAVLIPSPNVAENHQYYNAMELQKAGAAVVIEEKDLTGEKLISTVSGLLSEPGKLAAMGRNARSLSVDDSLDRIVDALLKLVKTP